MLYFANMIRMVLTIFFLSFVFSTKAQYEYVKEGEFGISVGGAHYFGDLNQRSAINRSKIAVGLYYQKQFNDYLAVRLSGHYAQVGYSDIYSNNEVEKLRNLSFNSNIWELALQGDFCFFKFTPGLAGTYTPYVTLGIGLFNFNPFAYIDGRKVFLQPLGTEGQNIEYVDVTGKKRTPYKTTAVCIPIGAGIKYNISSKVNLFVQAGHRLTLTDYLDDVSTTYVGRDKFPALPGGLPSDAAILQDRSFEKGTTIGLEGLQRGKSKQKDQYLIAEVGISFNLFGSYRCPSY